jgi:hypothetical protein
LLFLIEHLSQPRNDFDQWRRVFLGADSFVKFRSQFVVLGRNGINKESWPAAGADSNIAECCVCDPRPRAFTNTIGLLGAMPLVRLSDSHD